MAYDHNMWKLVDLIDIFSLNTDKRLIKCLSRRYVTDIELENFKTSLEMHSTIKRHAITSDNKKVENSDLITEDMIKMMLKVSTCIF